MNSIKKLKNIAVAGGLFLLTAWVNTSCDTTNDWSVDESYDRLFRTTSISVVPTATEAEVTWGTGSKADFYIIEISKDSLYQDDIQTGSIVFGEDKSITKSPFTLTNLDSDTKYYLRIKSCSNEKISSKWAYHEKFSFKTKSEQIMSPVASEDLKATSVTLRWTAGKTVTNMDILTPDLAVIKTINLDADAIANGYVTVTGLTPNTSYTANLYNGTVKRGYISFTTYPEVPEADKMIYLNANDSINQTLFDDLAGSYSTVTLAIPAGAVFANNNTLTIPNGMSVNFFGLPGASKAVLSIKQITLSANHSFINFTNVDISGYVYENGVATSSLNSYLFNQTTATNVGAITFDNCLIHDLANTPFRLQGSEAKTIGTLTFNNCIVTNLKDSYYFINADASGNGVISNINITNSTFNTVGRFILSKSTNTNSITLSDCTFYNMIASGRYFIDFGSTSYGPANGISIKNSIFALSQVATAKGIRSAGTVTVENSYATSDWQLGSPSISGLISYSGASSALFTSPTTGDFSFLDKTFAGTETAGDPRWRE